MLCALPPLQIPTMNSHATRSRSNTQTATNTLHITHPSRTFFTPSSLSTLKSIIAPLAPSGILSFSPLKSLRRVIIVFSSPADARAVRLALDNQTRLPTPTSNSLQVHDADGDISMSSSESSCAEEEDAESQNAPIRCYYGENTIISAEKKLLKVGERERRKREFEGEKAPAHDEEEEEKIAVQQQILRQQQEREQAKENDRMLLARSETFNARKRSSSLILLESDGRKPAIEVEEF